MNQAEIDRQHMSTALALAARGQGWVEPNPMVGCVVAHGEEVVGQGWHKAFGEPHAEVEALRQAGENARGATLYVSLEPCCHQGKTPPCTDAIIAAGIRRVVAAVVDPFAAVAGQGFAELKQSGIEVETGLLEDQARHLNSPYLMRLTQGRPWVIAKWAMTLDGKIATRTGESRWISGDQARAVAHKLRGRVDGILVGRRTVERDDPSLTARPPGPRLATRIVLDSEAHLPSSTRLTKTAGEVPVLVVAGPRVRLSDCERLRGAGVEVLVIPETEPVQRIAALLKLLGRRGMTNVLVEGGGTLFGSLLDAQAIDEMHVFIAPLVIGGSGAMPAVGGHGLERLTQALRLESPLVEVLGEDVYISGRVGR